MRSLLWMMLLLMISCSVEPKPINYGQDACHYCQMIIVDQAYAAQMVTEKGKAYKYDATECMMQHLANWDGPPVAHLLVSDYAHPGNLINASEAHFLFSEHIPSPMGAYLSAFANEQSRTNLVQPGDRTVNWQQLCSHYKVPDRIISSFHHEE